MKWILILFLFLIPLISAETTFFEENYFILGEIPIEEIGFGGGGFIEEVILKEREDFNLICNEISLFLTKNNLKIEELKEKDLITILEEINIKTIYKINLLRLEEYQKNYDSFCKEKINIFQLILIFLFIFLFFLIYKNKSKTKDL